MNIIKINSLTKNYSAFRALDNVNLSIKKGEIFGLLGPNGAGKTTLLSIVEGLLKYDSGEIRLFNKSYIKDRKYILKNIGVQLQSSAFIPELNLIEQIIVMASLYDVKVTVSEAEEFLEMVGLKSRAKSYINHLSGGQKQRLSLILAIVHKPKILFLDEPTTGLDPQTKMMLWELIRNFQNDGLTVVLTTHNIQEAESLCNRVGVINKGKIIAVDTPVSLINKGEGLSVVTVSSGLQGYDIVNSCSGVLNSDYTGNEFRITTSDVIGTIKDLFEVAGNNKTYLGNLYIKQPNLEDIFLELTGTSLSGREE
ncbi:MAG: ABC transporter ATP-binding protein [Spirochaetales bacterium]|nr:ABC transporter ATP-binding protein [Spirochaetales bacterium]